MKAVALLVVYLGYGVLVYGLDHVMGNCTPLGCAFLGQFAGSGCPSGSLPCAGASGGSAGNSGPPTVVGGVPKGFPGTGGTPGRGRP